MGDLSTSLRALAHPGSVLALVLLVLNDHVLKQAWPGWVTGKLSDVAGLVVAPLLLSVVLTATRVPRPTTVAVSATGLGFVACKTSAVGAALTSSVWSLFGTPTMIRADATDLLALPALYAAWWIHRTTAEEPPRGWRRAAAASLGMLMLPVGVLATSATSCAEWRGHIEVAVLEGDFPGTPHEVETRLASNDEGGWLTIDREGRFAEPGVQVSGDRGWGNQRQRSCVGDRCWRLVGTDAVDGSTDGGRTWVREGRLTESDRDDITDEEGDESCGDPLPIGATDIAAMDVDGVVWVIAALQRGGIWQRNYDGTWTVLTIDRLRELVERDRPPPPLVTELDATPQEPAESPDSPTSSETPTPTCPSPTTVTATPHPSNGPPTSYEVCP